jgi:hypothetical protein
VESILLTLTIGFSAAVAPPSAQKLIFCTVAVLGENTPLLKVTAISLVPDIAVAVPSAGIGTYINTLIGETKGSVPVANTLARALRVKVLSAVIFPDRLI